MRSINVLLTFLSTVRLDKGNVDKKFYKQLEIDGLGETHTTNESGIRYVLKQLHNSEETLNGYVFMISEKVKWEQISYDNTDFSMTHYEYILKRLSEIISISITDLQSQYIRTVFYHEEANKDFSVSSAVEAIQEVLNFQKQYKESSGSLPSVKLYLDLSGGPRDANMLLLIISRMLEYYKSISIEDVIYSNLLDKTRGQVQCIVGAYHLLDLVSGVYEFNQSGSVSALEKYFKLTQNENNNPVLEKLINAMRFFSECILLCRYGEFVESIKNLDSSIKEFETVMTKDDTDERIDVSAELLNTLIPTVKDKYDELFAAVSGETIDDIKLFRWCYENNCLQQAITLITERTPELLLPEDLFNDKGNKKILFVAEEKKKDLEEAFEKRDEKKDTKSQWLLFKYHRRDHYDSYSFTMNSEEARKKLKDFFLEMLKEMAGKKFIKNYDAGKCQKKYKSFLEKMKEATTYDIFVDWELIAKNIEQFVSFCRNTCLDEPVGIDLQSADGVIVRNFSKEIGFKELSLKDFLIKFSNGEIKPLENIDVFSIIGTDAYYPAGNYGSIANMLDTGILKTKVGCDVNKVKEVLLLYYEIKDERNFINHAHDEKQRITFGQLKDKMKRFVTLLHELYFNS